jgi:hypothetical protein
MLGATMNIRPHRLPVIIALAAFAALGACSKKDQSEKAGTADKAVPVDTEAPPVVVAMIDAHGGMPGWRVARTLSFDSEFHMADDSVTTSSRVTVDLAKRRAYVDFGHGETMAWDGKRAWSTHWTQPYPPGLRAVLDAYMVQLPWLAMDPGAKLAVAGKDSLWTGPTLYSIVKMSLRPAAPGGPYRLYIDPQTKRLHACAFNAAEGEEFVVFGEAVKAEGMMLPSHYAIYNASHTPLAAVTLGNWSSGRPFDENKMSMPDSALVAQPTP